ncbi:aspartate/glutamate racemase family protein [Desulfopila inferna]|uniref:aspartate/glutamate racemase family protein n=1 Tax=Desulfopila inferna TaxID=468528 RepID=UPI0019668D6A|nr:aspartate/glutamate racemase family protein [Desulfopila inferna]MBM9606001.1 aspartate/glutamate racemase family protein [Desulfopila inferna]
MIYHTRKGRISSGEAIGILLLDTSVPFIPGDVANATTYDFPVRYKKVEGFTVARAIGKDPSIYPSLLSAAKDLMHQGVRAITGDCGFMALHQNRLSRELDIPVFLSSLLQIPFILTIIGEGRKVGILTADGTSLDGSLLTAVGVSEGSRLVIEGLESCPSFYRFAIEESGELDVAAVQEEIVAAAKKVAANSEVACLLLECSLLPPYGVAIQEAVDLPVFDYITMINFVFSAVVKKKYHGFI